MVEFAIVLLPLLAVIFGAIEMDRMLLVYTTVSNASRAGVRYGIVHGYDRKDQAGVDGPSSAGAHDNVDAIVRAIARAAPIDTSSTKLTVTVTYSNLNNDPNCSGPDFNNPGCSVAVTASYAYDPFTSFFPLSVNLSSMSQGIITY